MFMCTDLLSSRGLLRKNRAWCPLCYEEDAEVYEHLLWCLESVMVCPHHDRPLETRCPHCRIGLPIISWRSVPGFCSSCCGWMGLPLEQRCTPHSVPPVRTLEWGYRAAESLGELLATAPNLKNAPGRDRIIWSLVALIGSTDVGVLAQKLDIDYVTAWTWSTGGVRLLVARLLLICAKLGVSIVEFLTSDTFAPSSTDAENPLVPAAPAIITYSPNKTHERKRRRNVSLLGRARRHLEKTLEAGVLPPPSLLAVCRDGGYTKPYMYRHFPALCREISLRWMAWKQKRGAERREPLAAEVRAAAARLHDKGTNPSTLNVARLLSQPGSIRDPKARAALREFRQFIGLVDPGNTQMQER